MSAPVLPSYNLAAPTEEYARSALARMCCADTHAADWERLRASIGAVAGRPLSLEELGALAERCVSRPGCQRAFGISLRVRIQTYLALRERSHGRGAA